MGVPVHKLNERIKLRCHHTNEGRLATLTLIADDYAMTAGVSRGILRLLEHGRISGAGAMTNRPHWKGWSHAFRGFHGQRDLGLHLNLTLGKPLTAMPSFAGGGTLPAIGEIAKGALSMRLPLDEIKFLPVIPALKLARLRNYTKLAAHSKTKSWQLISI